MDDIQAKLFERVIPVLAAIIVVGAIAIIEAMNGETNIVTALVGIIGILAGIKIPSDIFNKSSN